MFHLLVLLLNSRGGWGGVVALRGGSLKLCREVDMKLILISFLSAFSHHVPEHADAQVLRGSDRNIFSHLWPHSRE